MDALWICHGIMAKFSGGNSPLCLDLPKRRILNSVHKQKKLLKYCLYTCKRTKRQSTEPECSSKTDIPIQIKKTLENLSQHPIFCAL